jgi:hypothetical protein
VASDHELAGHGIAPTGPLLDDTSAQVRPCHYRQRGYVLA